MELAPFKQDIDDLLEEFTQEGLTGFADMKRVWLSRKFTFVYERSPKRNSAVFMQGLYAHCISHIVSAGSLSQRLGGLYCLYCLYETQPFKPFFKIYISIGELKQIKELIVDSKQNGIGVLPALVKRMVKESMFLFGFSDIADDSLAQRVDEITKFHDKHVQIAQQKLFENTRIEDYLHMDLGAELDLKELKKMSAEYTREKELAIEDAGQIVGIDDIKHIAKNSSVAESLVENIVEQWDAQKDLFYKQTGVNCNEIVPFDDFEEELEYLLTEE